MIFSRNMKGLLQAIGSAALLLAPTAHASAGEISNVADATWTVGSVRQATRSNEVTFEVGAPQVRVLTYVPMPGAPTSVELEPSYCAPRASAFATASVPPNGGGIVSTPIMASRSVHAGQQVVLIVQAPSANRDPATADVLELLLVSVNGDEERVRAVETGADTGEFLAALVTTARGGSARGDCQLAVQDHSTILVRLFSSDRTTSYPVAQIEAQADPFGIVFDSATGEPVDGARVSLVDAATGALANVFAFDGVTPYPATIVTGQTVLDAAGRSYPMVSGGYQFPLVALGRYRLKVEPPPDFTAPSAVPASDLAGLPRPGGGAFSITDASYGNAFALVTLDPLQVDIPVDGPGGAIGLQKSASRDRTQPGDVVVYRVTVRNRDTARASGPLQLQDIAPSTLRLRPGTVRIDGEEPATGRLSLSGDGRGFSLQLASLRPQQDVTVTYAMGVRPDAGPGVAVNRATVRSRTSSAEAQARIRIERDTIAGRMTLIGRVTAGGCSDPRAAQGIPGVRLVLEDGSFAVTDAEGRYHFEGLVPGTHAVQLQAHTLPKGSVLSDCGRSTASAGSASTRFIRGQGGSLAVADFRAAVPEDSLSSGPAGPIEVAVPGEDRDGPTDLDWLTAGDGPDGFLAPSDAANPRSPAVRVAVRHRPGAQVSLTVDGSPVDPLSFEGVQTDPSGAFAVSHWRGIHLKGAETVMVARIAGPAGAAQEFSRTVHFADTPMQAEIVPELSKLVADGTTPPVVAIRLRDRHGRPVHEGVSGAFSLEGPYRSATAASAQRQQDLSGFASPGATWVVQGDEGVALVELEPTLVSGSMTLRIDFADGETRRTQEIEAWVQPGDQPWTLIGIAEGSAGARSVADNMERADGFDSDFGDDARLAFYAKGKILGRYLLTLSYDSARQRADQPLLGVIDPAAYYTIFADGSQRPFDAQSREKLYVRIESDVFYALYGDFLTGFVNTSLAYYQRAATGVKGEGRIGAVQAQAFAARIASRHRRDEIQGSGLTGPYQLSSRFIVPNSERVAVEVRDRLRSEVILERRELVRFADYTVDLLTGAIVLSQPLAGRGPGLDPQFLVVDYEVDEQGRAEWNAGARVTWSGLDGRLRIGASAITDKGDAARSNLGAGDLRLKIDEHTEFRAELATSSGGQGTGHAWTTEVRHHKAERDITAYARQIDRTFGVGQQNLAERGRRKIGVDARIELAPSLSAVASGWLEQSLEDSASRRAVEARLVHKSEAMDLYAGIAHLSDRRADGLAGRSTVLEAGGTRRLLDNRLELSGSTSFALTSAEAVDLPNRHRLGLRYSISPRVKAVASYEVAKGASVKSRSLQAGVELAPIPGSRITTTFGKQSFDRDSSRDFAAFSLGQSLPLGESLTLDLAVDGNRTIGGGIGLADTANPAHPATSGGHLGSDGTLGEDYTAYSLGAAWRYRDWSARGRAEWRDGEFADRRAITTAIVRDLGAGKVAGGGISWSRATDAGGTAITVADAALSVAWRPDDSALAMLGKLEFRSDTLENGVAGATSPVGRSVLLAEGDARSRRLILSTSANWSPRGEEGESRTEASLFAAVRHDLDSVEGQVIEGTSLLGGFDLRIGIGSKVEIGGRATVRTSLAEGTTSFAIGPEIGFSPAKDTLVSVGYNVVGFRDRDFEEARSTHRGLFASIRLKFDQDSFGFLGLRK